MVEFDKEKIAKMQQYLAEITDPNFQGSATDKRMAVAELFNYYHSDWQKMPCILSTKILNYLMINECKKFLKRITQEERVLKQSSVKKKKVNINDQ